MTPDEMAKKKVARLSQIEDMDNKELFKDKGEDGLTSSQQASTIGNTAKAVNQKGSTMTKVGGGMLAVSPATGPAAPYVAGAGAGLMTVGAIADAKNAEKQAQYNAEVDKLAKQQAAMNNMAGIAQRFKRL